MKDRERRLEEITKDLHNLSNSPLISYRKKHDYHPVPGEGNPDSDVILIREAPGEKEAESGRPFVGSGGKILDELLESIGLSRESVFITNLVKDRPPENRDPTKNEIESYETFLWREIEIIRPRLIATLGRFAMQFILEAFNHPQKDRKIGEIHGNLLQGKADYGDVYLLPLYHPAAVLYNRDLESTLKEDIQVLKVFLDSGRAEPQNGN